MLFWFKWRIDYIWPSSVPIYMAFHSRYSYCCIAVEPHKRNTQRCVARLLHPLGEGWCVFTSCSAAAAGCMSGEHAFLMLMKIPRDASSRPINWKAPMRCVWLYILHPSVLSVGRNVRWISGQCSGLDAGCHCLTDVHKQCQSLIVGLCI